MKTFSLSGQVVDIASRRIFPATVTVANGRIQSIQPAQNVPDNVFLLPGFIDAHVHVESSMLIPSEFARLASVHGTVATISDPHEIGNILGLEGVRYMLDNGRQVPFHFYFGAPSCVPATAFETAGAAIDAEDIRTLLKEDGLHYLSEMMNFPGVLQRDPLVMQKIAIAHEMGKPVDGHAPGLRGEDALHYIQAGISTDHECFTLEEALDKARHGMKILIREGSAARNFDALHPLIKSHPHLVMFCSDDKHPNELVQGHINQLVKRAIVDHGYDLFDVLHAACLAPIAHYRLEVGQLRPGDFADFIVVNNLQNFDVQATYIKGELVAYKGRSLINRVQAPIVNHFHCQPKKVSDFALTSQSGQLRVIEAIDGQLITHEKREKARVQDGQVVADPARDLLKLAVVNRYADAPVALAFVQAFGLKEGAIASCIAHDSHNIICVGASDEAMCRAVNALIEHKGGISVVQGDQVHVLPLPVGGIMSADDGYQVAKSYIDMDQRAKQLGSHLQAPFMTLSFMALLVIPNLKLSDRGLFDGTHFKFTDLFVTQRESQFPSPSS